MWQLVAVLIATQLAVFNLQNLSLALMVIRLSAGLELAITQQALRPTRSAAKRDKTTTPATTIQAPMRTRVTPMILMPPALLLTLTQALMHPVQVLTKLVHPTNHHLLTQVHQALMCQTLTYPHRPRLLLARALIQRTQPARARIQRIQVRISRCHINQ